MKIGLNGTICDELDAVVSVYDHGFLYGMGLFETFRTYGGRPFLLQEHLNRLDEGCLELGIHYQADAAKVETFIGELLEVNRLTDAYIRFTVSAGTGLLGLPDKGYDKPEVIVYLKALPLHDPVLYQQGKPLQRLQLRRNTPEGAVRLKSFHYMNNMLANRELRQYAWAQGAEGLLLNDSGYLAEGIVSNLFFIKHQVCYTPAISTGILPGITRAFILELAAQSALVVQEGNFEWNELLDAEEIFITNSIQELVPINRLFDEQGKTWQVGEGSAGTRTLQLMELYRTYAGNRK